MREGGYTKYIYNVDTKIQIGGISKRKKWIFIKKKQKKNKRKHREGYIIKEKTGSGSVVCVSASSSCEMEWKKETK